MSFISGIYMGLGLIALLLNIRNVRAGQPYQKYVIIYIAFFLLQGAAAIAVAELSASKNNLFLFHVYNPIEYLILSYVYINSFESKAVKHAIKVSIPIVLFVAFVLSAFVQTIDVNNTYFIMIESILMVFWSLLFIRETIILQKEDYLQQYPMFWVTIGILFYFIGNLFVEALLNYLMEQSIELSRNLYRFSFIFKYLLLILLMVSSISRAIFRNR